MNARLAFFDRARFRLVLGVVLLHAACGYSRYVPWWHARGGPSPLADVLVAGLDVFLMPFLYFIAGCFAPASAAQVSPGGFVARKARRLLAPILPLVFFFLPAMVYAGYRQRTADPAGFFDFWRASLVALTNFRPWCIASLEQALGPQNILSQHHLWFLPLLFLFFLLYRFAPGLRASLAGRPRSLGLAWLAAGAATVAAMTALGSVLPVGIWWRWNILLLCQPVRLPLYAAAFLLGAQAGLRGRDFERLRAGRAWPSLAGAAAALAATFVLGPAVHVGGPAPAVAMALYATATVAANGLLLLGCLRLGAARPRPLSPREALLARGSYAVYLLHMPLVVFAELALPAGLAPSLAMLLASLAAVSASLALGALGKRLGPAASLAGLALFFVGMCLAYP
ncbi:acyltransferase family protein [Solidesulfovibrio sp.]|uniref:acyltransferase family protein n=1 Tax=Solidesulfovibrio sp. TaxID=2910990 RepID=UPI002B1F651B|nr:acyltransferase family protein [Solidesulfovibrio sp.]MEA4858190.1 acyltransferase family protein [Solidesulfovibrio sp.]